MLQCTGRGVVQLTVTKMNTTRELSTVTTRGQNTAVEQSTLDIVAVTQLWTSQANMKINTCVKERPGGFISKET